MLSGIVGILQLDGAPVDRRWLKRLTQSMAYQGPDGQQTWSKDCIGLGHALLCTTPESHNERQPCCLNDRVWITAEARIDGRMDLLRELKSRGRQPADTAADVELILHAYHTWGLSCVDYLLGDFAFAIWDQPRKRLLCVRDHQGLKPFYYAHLGSRFIFSSNLSCLLQHPSVSTGPNSLSLADFLLFGANSDGSTTFFSDVRCLTAGHTLTCSQGTVTLKRYWTFPDDKAIRYKRPQEYVEHFSELLRVAVADRLRTPRVGSLMSGGLDSTGVTAAARDVLAEGSNRFDLHAYTVGWDSVTQSDEYNHAELAAKALGIPIHYTPLEDDYVLYSDYRPEGHPPAGIDGPLGATFIHEWQRMAGRCRVCLMGNNGDPILRRLSHSYFLDLLRDLRWGRLLLDAVHFSVSYRRWPLLLFADALRRRIFSSRYSPTYPTWLNPQFEAWLKLRERRERLLFDPGSSPLSRRASYVRKNSTYRPHGFEMDDSGMTFAPVEVRQPLFDLRLVRYVFSIPPVPYLVDKEILCQGRCDTSCPRPSCGVPRRPFRQLQCSDITWTRISKGGKLLRSAPGLGEYVDIRKAVDAILFVGKGSFAQTYLAIAPLSLAVWLHRRAGSRV